jgi:hypothetical protein
VRTSVQVFSGRTTEPVWFLKLCIELKIIRLFDFVIPASAYVLFALQYFTGKAGVIHEGYDMH